MSEQTQTPLERRENFKKRMTARGRLPKEKDDKGVKNNEVYSQFELWQRYKK